MTSKEVLKKYWGYNSFRDTQEAIINSVLEYNDTIALLPTGGGKSICYQVPTMMGHHKKAIVVSPLISLMNDQVDNLNRQGIKAIALHSGLSKFEIDIALDNFIYGSYHFLYISPERILSPLFQTRLGKMKIDLIAIDEAHCISQWGFDFRPSYLTIPMIRQFHSSVPIIALTATATKKVISDIEKQLELRRPKIFSKSFARENIQFFAIESDNKNIELLNILRKLNGSGIIYTRNRRKTVQLAKWLEQYKFSTGHYHAGMSAMDRNLVQEKWKKGDIRIVVATNAFGMGIDKANVQFVIHMDIPNSIEEYYQEAGRAGRNGNISYAISIYNNHDLTNLLDLFEKQFPTFDQIKSTYITLCQYLKIAIGAGINETRQIDISDFIEFTSIEKSIVHSALKILEQEGWITRSEGIKQPPKLMITASKEEIYNLPYSEELYSDILSYTLRNYEGVWTLMTNIDEHKMSKDLEIDIQKLIFFIKVMAKDGIVNYKASTSGNSISFIRSRPHNSNFSIEKHRYAAIKEMTLRRLKKMINYFTTSECRQKTILSYFEEESQNCGRCDICMGSHDIHLSKEDEKILKSHLNKFTQGYSLKKYLLAWPYHKRKAVRNTLLQLENKEILSLVGDQIILKIHQN